MAAEAGVNGHGSAWSIGLYGIGRDVRSIGLHGIGRDVKSIGFHGIGRDVNC